MAKYKDRAARVEGRSVVESPRYEDAEVETRKLAEQREDSQSRNREGGKEEEKQSGFPIRLIHPSNPVNVYEHFANALNDFQHALYYSKDDSIKHLTITQATLDAPVMPDLHHSPYCGFKVVKGDGFSVRLSNGKIIHAVSA